jgi:hypothetical protein
MAPERYLAALRYLSPSLVGEYLRTAGWELWDSESSTTSGFFFMEYKKGPSVITVQCHAEEPHLVGPDRQPSDAILQKLAEVEDRDVSEILAELLTMRVGRLLKDAQIERDLATATTVMLATLQRGEKPTKKARLALERAQTASRSRGPGSAW